MTQRKGEITRPEIKRKWPHHVVLSADKVRGVRNSVAVWLGNIEAVDEAAAIEKATHEFQTDSRWLCAVRRL